MSRRRHKAHEPATDVETSARTVADMEEWLQRLEGPVARKREGLDAAAAPARSLVLRSRAAAALA